MTEGIQDVKSFLMGGLANNAPAPYVSPTDVSIKWGLIEFLRNSADVEQLVSKRIYSRRLPPRSKMPALVIHKISERRETISHSGRGILIETSIQIDVHAESEKEIETLDRVIEHTCNCYRGKMGSIDVESCFVEDSTNSFDDEAENIKHFMQHIELLITWRN